MVQYMYKCYDRWMPGVLWMDPRETPTWFFRKLRKYSQKHDNWGAVNGSIARTKDTRDRKEQQWDLKDTGYSIMKGLVDHGKQLDFTLTPGCFKQGSDLAMFALWKDLPGYGAEIGEGGQIWNQGDHQVSGAMTQNLHSDNLNWAVPWAWSNMRGCKEPESIELVVESGRLGTSSEILEVQLSRQLEKKTFRQLCRGQSRGAPKILIPTFPVLRHALFLLQLSQQ